MISITCCTSFDSADHYILYFFFSCFQLDLILFLLGTAEICSTHEIKQRVETDFSRSEKFFVIGPTKLESKKLLVQDKDDEEIYGDSCTVGSTSKSSSEWRSSINCRDSGTDDPFSSSSRRSCPKWESYTVFQKYDEEMMFLDRISAQKLQETGNI